MAFTGTGYSLLWPGVPGKGTSPCPISIHAMPMPKLLSGTSEDGVLHWVRTFLLHVATGILVLLSASTFYISSTHSCLSLGATLWGGECRDGV